LYFNRYVDTNGFTLIRSSQ